MIMDFDGSTLGAINGHINLRTNVQTRCGLNTKDNAAEETVGAFGSLYLTRLHHEAAGHEQHSKHITNHPNIQCTSTNSRDVFRESNMRSIAYREISWCCTDNDVLDPTLQPYARGTARVTTRRR